MDFKNSEIKELIYEEQTFLASGLLEESQEKIEENQEQVEEKTLTPDEKKEIVLREQKLGTDVNTIAEMLGTTYPNLRSFMNRQGYKADNGIFKPKNFKEDNYTQGILDINEIGDDFIESEEEPKKYTQVSLDFIDKINEAYDWYLDVKNSKKFRTKAPKRIKELSIQEDYSDEEEVSVKFTIPKSVAEDFERLSANSNYDRNDIITQAIVWYLEEYNYMK